MLSSSTPYDVSSSPTGGIQINIERDGAKNHAEIEGHSQEHFQLSHATERAVKNQVHKDLKKNTPFIRFFNEIKNPPKIAITTTLVVSFAIWFLIEFLIIPFYFSIPIGSENWLAIFVLSSDNIHYLWTWITNVFGHAGFAHLFVNSLVLVSFGYFVEEELKPKYFLALFLLGGIISGVVQVATAAILSEQMRVIGASGGVAAVIGCASMLFPELRVSLFFIIPMKIVTSVLIFIFGSLIAVLIWGIGAGNIAHIAHITGLIFGVSFGYYYRETHQITTELFTKNI